MSCQCLKCDKTTSVVNLLTLTINRKQSYLTKLKRQAEREVVSDAGKTLIEMLGINIEELKKIRDDLK